MKIIFCLSQFTKENLRLQPWLTVHRVSREFIVGNHDVHIITDTDSNEFIDGITIHKVETLRGTHSDQITRLLHSLQPDIVLVSVTPLSLVTAKWYRAVKKFNAYAFLSYPFYNFNEIFKAFPHLSWRERWSYGRHLLVPRVFWTKYLTFSFNGVFCQSKRTGERIKSKTGKKIPVHVIPPGIDKELWRVNSKKRKAETVFLYAGRASKIRGFFIALDAFAQLSDPQTQLIILARGADDEKMNEIEKELENRKIRHRAVIIGGWLNGQKYKQEIQSADAVLIPFVLVPSELPVTVMEVICCGTPAIVSNIDGLPDAVGKAGIVVSQADCHDLATAMKEVHLQKKQRSALNRACTLQRNRMKSWQSVAALWLEILENGE